MIRTSTIVLFNLIIFLSACGHNKTGNGRLLIISHRGSSGYIPEHTLEGVAMAHAFNVDYIEPDVVMTKDKKLVVLHDPFLDTTTDVAIKYPHKKRSDGRFWAMDFTLKEIKQLKVYERLDEDSVVRKNPKIAYPERFPNGLSVFSVPTLEEVIILIQGLNHSRQKLIGLYVEVKAPNLHEDARLDIMRETFLLLKQYGYNQPGAPIFFQCFDPVALKKFKRDFDPKFPLIQLIAENDWKESAADYLVMQTDEGLKEIASYAQGIGPWIPHVLNYEDAQWKSSGLSTRAHKLGLKVHAYTARADSLPQNINSFDELILLLKNVAKVDGVFTDQPDMFPL